MNFKKIKSIIDPLCVNYVINKNRLTFEARIVPKPQSKTISLYVSSHGVCSMGCKFCWLTTQGQTNMAHLNITDFIDQLKVIQQDNKMILSQDIYKKININFMARGDPLANKYIIKSYPEMYDKMQQFFKLPIKINLSSIFPHNVKHVNFNHVFNDKPVYLYCSLYTIDDEKKKKMMPNALPAHIIIQKLLQYQQVNKNALITFHNAFIKGFNDTDYKEWGQFIKESGLSRTKFNIVRFNPPTNSNMVEAENIPEIYEYLKTCVDEIECEFQKIRVVPRVAPDAYVSCGMFAPEN